MSQTGPGVADLPLFAPSAGEPVKKVHRKAARRHPEFLARVRDLVAQRYAGTGAHVSTDEVWAILDQEGLGIPAGASPNVLAGMLAGWKRATAVGWTRSRREKANRNLLRVYEIK